MCDYDVVVVLKSQSSISAYIFVEGFYNQQLLLDDRSPWLRVSFCEKLNLLAAFKMQWIIPQIHVCKIFWLKLDFCLGRSDCSKHFVPVCCFTECRVGTFKSDDGNGPCLVCPPHSFSIDYRSKICRCSTGFYRTPEDHPTSRCTSTWNHNSIKRRK